MVCVEPVLLTASEWIKGKSMNEAVTIKNR